MLAFVAFVVLGIGFFILQSRIARIDRVMKQVVVEVQRQRNLLAAHPDLRAPDTTADPVPTAEAPPTEEVAPPRIIPAEAPIPVPAEPIPAAKPEPEPAYHAQPEPAAAPLAARIAPPRIAIEELLGSKLPIWGGGITLAVAGFFIVKYSIDVGLLSPGVRVVLALIFAIALVIGGEFTRRWPPTAIDPRVSQALAGAGIAVAYGAILMAANVYALVGTTTAFAGLAVVTVAALAVAVRLGAPSAVLGLVGGLSAPAMVGGSGSIATLAIYLTLTIAGIAGVARHQKWRWLAAAALLGGFGWGAIMLVMQAIDLTATLSIGAYLIVLAFAVPIIAGRDAAGLVRLLPPTLAAAQLAILIVQGGYGPLVWAFYGLLAIGVIALARIEASQRLLPPMALAVGVAVAAIWPAPPFALFSAVVIVGMLIFAGDAAQRIPRGGARDAGQLAGALIAALALGYFKTKGIVDPAWALIALALSTPAVTLGWRLRRDAQGVDLRFVILVATALILLDAAVALALPHLWWGPPMAALAAVAAFVARDVAEARVAAVARVGLALAISALFVAPHLPFAARPVATLDPWLSALRLTLAAVAAAAFARVEIGRRWASLVEALAALLFSLALEQVVPVPWCATANLFAALALVEVARIRGETVFAGVGALVAVGILWTAEPLALVAEGALAAMAGMPLLVTMLPAPVDAIVRLIVPAVLLGAIGWRFNALPSRVQRLSARTVGVIALAGLLVLWKQLFALDSTAAFVARGMTERVLLTTLLYAAGWAAWRRSVDGGLMRGIALALTALALARTGGFDVLLYNPLWVRQQVGAWPLINVLAPAFVLPLFWLSQAAQRAPVLADRAARFWTGIQIALVLVMAAATVRQWFHGSLLTVGSVGTAEDIVRSLAAIAVAIGFLVWGIRVRIRAWRIASLVLMLAAVGKVFLFDASGLEGLTRIASFVALGLSLIGIGWLYSRYLTRDDAPLPKSDGQESVSPANS